MEELWGPTEVSETMALMVLPIEEIKELSRPLVDVAVGLADPVSRQEQADEIADGESWHIDTKVGRPVVEALTVVV